MTRERLDSPPIFIVSLDEAAAIPDIDPQAREALGDTSLYSPRALARALAHIALWRRCAEDGAPLTVCEDHAVLCADFAAASARLLQTAPDYDFVLWGWRPDAVVVGGQAPDAEPTLVPLTIALGMVSYTLSPEGARRLLSRALPFTGFTLRLPLTPQPRANSDLDVAVSRCLGDMAALACSTPLATSAFGPQAAPVRLSREAALQSADLLQRQGRPGEALAVLQAAAEASPDHAALLGKLGVALAAEDRLAAASAALERAFAIEGAHDMAAYNLATLRLRQQRHAEALQLLGPVLQRNPGFELAHANAGLALLALGRHADAEAVYRRGLALNEGLDQTRRGLAAVLTVRSGLHEQQGAFEAAHAAAVEATQLQPDLAAAFNNLGVAHLRLGRPAEAEAAYRTALELSPTYADAHYGLSFALLKQARWREAWPEYDWRLTTTGVLPWASAFDSPRWDGTAAPGATLLLAAEQGLGDTIMTARFAALARERVGRIVLHVPGALAGVLASLPGVDAVAANEEPAPDHDLWCPLMSLPGLLGVDPAFSPEVLPKLRADPGKVRAWADALPRDGLRIGIAWQGNRTARVEPGRSIPLEAFRPLATAPGVQLVSLQKGAGEEQLSQWGGAGRPLELGEAYRAGDFADTAAVIANLDLMICCDTSVAHLAGAIDRPVWIAIADNCDWRWLQDRDDSIWYESTRLLRQRPGEAWETLLGRAALSLNGR